MHAFNQSLSYDRKMYAADIRGSIAYAKSLTLVGILTKDEETRIVDGLTAVKKEWESGQVGFLSLHLIICHILSRASFRSNLTMRTFIRRTNGA